MRNSPLFWRLSALAFFCLLAQEVFAEDAIRRELHGLYREGAYFKCLKRAHRLMENEPGNAVAPFYAALSVGQYRRDTRIKAKVANPIPRMLSYLTVAKERDPEGKSLVGMGKPMAWLQKVLFRYGEKGYAKDPEGVRRFFDKVYTVFDVREGPWANRFHHGREAVDPEYDFSDWDHPFYRLANTGRHFSGLNPEAAQVIYLHNLCRLNPPLFERTFLRKYLDQSPYLRESKYVKSLIQDLREAEPRKLLVPDANLVRAANSHAQDLSSTGTFSHTSSNGTSFSRRLKQFNVTGSRAENIAAGQSDPIEVFMDLMIDSGVPSLGHRHNILNPGMESIGVGIRQKEGEWKIWVFDFCS